MTRNCNINLNRTFAKKQKMIKVGDKVKFLNDVGGGVVTSFIGKNLVNVENEDGFEIPCPISELVNISDPNLSVDAVKAPVQKVETEAAPKIEIQQPAGEIINGKNSPDFYFCFVPEDSKNPVAGEIKLFLLNDSNYTLMYHYSHLTEGGIDMIKFGHVRSNSRILLESITDSDLSDLPEFGFQLMYFKDSDKQINEAITKKFKINPVKFYKESSFFSNSYFKENAMILQISKNIMATEIDKLTDADFKSVIKAKEPKHDPVKHVRKQSPDEVVIDLHISELLDNWNGLSNREMLEIQMDKVESEMKLAINSQVKKIVFIHGVGQGVLKQEVSKLLKSKFKKYYFQDASFKEYGYGATMVTLRR